MKLLKLVPDHTNLDFMRWRNVALVLSIIATAASLAYTAFTISRLLVVWWLNYQKGRKVEAPLAYKPPPSWKRDVVRT